MDMGVKVTEIPFVVKAVIMTEAPTVTQEMVLSRIEFEDGNEATKAMFLTLLSEQESKRFYSKTYCKTLSDVL